MPKRTYDIAIVTVSTDKLDRDCLESVAKIMRASPLKTVFVMVDNGSTAFRAHEYVTSIIPDAIVLLREKNYGFGSSCNLGAKEADADFYFFLNPDTRIDDPEALDRLHRMLVTRPEVGIVAPLIRYMDGRIQETCRRYPSWYTPLYQRLPWFTSPAVQAHKDRFMMTDFDHATEREVDWAQGSALMIDGDLFRTLGGFDERFWMYYEDIDLCRRTWKAGRKVIYSPDTELFHTYGKESARMKNLFDGILHNRVAREHILSWIRYTLKWGTTNP